MHRDDGVFLRHMIDAIRKAMDLAEGIGREDLDKNEMLALSLVRLLDPRDPEAREPSGTSHQDQSRLPSVRSPWSFSPILLSCGW